MGLDGFNQTLELAKILSISFRCAVHKGECHTDRLRLANVAIQKRLCASDIETAELGGIPSRWVNDVGGELTLARIGVIATTKSFAFIGRDFSAKSATHRTDSGGTHWWGWNDDATGTNRK
jgi:hypothetical protein